MKRKIIFLVILFMYFMLPQFKVNAYLPNEIKNRKECEKIELATALEDGTLAKVECYDNYELAKEAMNNTLDNDNLVIIENGVIIDSKYGLIDYDVDYRLRNPAYANLYSNSTDKKSSGYIRPSSVSQNIPGPDDAALIDYDYNSKRAKIKVAGVVAWIDSSNYEIVPLAWVKTAQYYKVIDTEIKHYLPVDVYGSDGGYTITLDRKPDTLDDGKYYSYDGHYFYTDLKTMLIDYKNNNYDNAVNKDKPYYNFYQYLSFRTKSTYNADNINQYLSNRISDKTSVILNTGEIFVNTQNNYGVNAILMLAIGINESGNGRSSIARENNNLFGLGAIDSAPGENAKKFNSIEDCIIDFGYGWLSGNYLQPGDDRFFGANLGNKQQGINLKYASDPYWGEKAAANYYAFDKTFDFQDYKTYINNIAVLNDDYANGIYAKIAPGGNDVSGYYKLKTMNSTIVIVEEVEGISVDGNNIWYKIHSDPVLDSSLKYYADDTYKYANPKINYLWDTSYVYVPAVYFYKITSDSIFTPSVNPETNSPKSISSILGESSVTYTDTLITNINIKTDINTLKSNLESHGGIVSIMDVNGNTKTSGTFSTGDIVNIQSGTLNQKFSVAVVGDVNGDGEISASDYVQIKNHIMGSSKLYGAYLKASDVSNDNNVSASDYVQIKNYIMGSIKSFN